MIKLDPERIDKMTNEELEQALSALTSEPLHQIDAIELRELIKAELDRRLRANLWPNYLESQKLHKQKLAAIAALSDDELKERLRLKPDDRDLIRQYNWRASKHRRALVKQLRPRFAAMTNDELIKFATGPFDDTVRKIDVATALSELRGRIARLRDAASRLHYRRDYKEGEIKPTPESELKAIDHG